MKRSILSLAIVLTLLSTTTLLRSNTSRAANILVDFEDLTLPALPGGGYFRGDNGLVPAGGSNDGSFSSRGAGFNNIYNNYGGGFTGYFGWAYSNTTDVTTPGVNGLGQVVNESSAYHLPSGGGGAGSQKYGVASGSSAGTAVVTVPGGYRPLSMQVTNNTYAALSMLNGDGFAKKFGDNPLTPSVETDAPDFFLLKIIGRNDLDQPVGTVDFYLADFRNANSALDYIVDEWTTVDLSSLTAASKLTFALSSSDNSSFDGGMTFFMNTPSYFAMDNLELTAVPEPSTLALLLVGGIGAWMLRARRGMGRRA